MTTGTCRAAIGAIGGALPASGAWTVLAASTGAVLGPVAVHAQDMALPTIKVEAEATSDVGPDVGYVAINTTTGSKTDTPVELVPQSVSVVTEQEMIDRNPQELEQTLGYTAGVTASIWGLDGRFDQFLIRGFDIGTYGIFRDGLSQKSIGFSGFKIEPYGTQRVEVLRGAAGVLYGENDPGGMINVITKRPSFTPFREAFASYGSFDTVEAGFDVGGPLGSGGSLAYRLTGLWRDGQTQYENSQNDRFFIAPALTWAPSEATSLTILTNWQRDRLSPAVFLPVAGEDYPESLGPLPSGFADELPDFDHFDADVGSIGYQFAHDFEEGWSVRQNLRYSRQSTDYAELYFNGMANATTMDFVAFSVDQTAEIFNLDNQVQKDFTIAGTDHRLLLGADYNRYSSDGTQGYQDGYLIPVADPSYDFPVAPPPIYQDGKQIVAQYGLYLQDQAKVGDSLHLTLGMRQAWSKNSFDDRLSADGDTSQRNSAFLLNAGAVYEFANGLVPYASYAEGFTANVGTTFEGQVFEPTRGTQYEVGVKYRPASFEGFFTAALYDMTRTNVLTMDPEHPDFAVQTGEIESRGLELEGSFDLVGGLSTQASYTYTNAEITSSNDGDEGNRPPLVPEHQASIWGNYRFAGGALDGVSLGAGLRYIGQTWGDSANTRSVPGYTVADAALRYQFGRMEAAVNVTNLFDKSYYATCYPGGGCTPGDARQVTAQLTVDF